MTELFSGHFLFSRCYFERGAACITEDIRPVTCYSGIFGSLPSVIEPFVTEGINTISITADTSGCSSATGSYNLLDMTLPPSSIDPLWSEAYDAAVLFAPPSASYLATSDGVPLPSFLLYSKQGKVAAVVWPPKLQSRTSFSLSICPPAHCSPTPPSPPIRLALSI